MKKILFVLTSVILISCKESKPVDYALFSGTIKNANSNKLHIGTFKKLLPEIMVSDNGTFSDTIFNASGKYVFSDGIESAEIYLKNGDEIELTINAKEFDESIKYTGKGSEVNNYLAEKYLLIEQTVNNNEIYVLEELDFLAKVNELKENLKDDIENLDPAFSMLEKSNIECEYITQLKNYEHYHSYYAKKETFKVSNSFPLPNILKNMDFNNEDNYLFSSAYMNLANENFMEEYRIKRDEGIPSDDALKELLQKTKNQTIKNGLSFYFSQFVTSGTKNAEKLFSISREFSSDKSFKEKMTQKINQSNKVQNGKSSPLFLAYENNEGGTTSLSDLKGKYVFIDVWATWCGPCVAEAPFLNKVEKKYHDKNISFVSISLDKENDREKWKQMIQQKEMGGIQLRADNAFESDFIKSYRINAIPRFILIDPAGNIVNSHAPNPSDEKLISLFDELEI